MKRSFGSFSLVTMFTLGRPGLALVTRSCRLIFRPTTTPTCRSLLLLARTTPPSMGPCGCGSKSMMMSSQTPQPHPQRLASKSTELSPGLIVRRAIPQMKRRNVGPFVFLDHFGPTSSNMDVGPHPHIGLCTLTYLYSGGVLHRDSIVGWGTEQPILPDQVNFMCAGRGVVHSERPYDNNNNNNNNNDDQLLHGLQMWVALPKDQEDVDPSFHHSPTIVEIPTNNDDCGCGANSGGVKVKLVVGEALGHRQENVPLVPGLGGMFFLSVEFGNEGGGVGEWTCPPLGDDDNVDVEVGIYVASGSVTVNGNERLEVGEMLVLADDGGGGCEPVRLKSNVAGTRVAVLGGRAHPEPRRLLWNFCSSEKDKLERAAEDWSRLDRSAFPPVVGESNDDSMPMPYRFVSRGKK